MPEINQEPDPQAESDRRFPFWTILPWTLLAATLLLLLPRVFHSNHTGTPPATVAAQPPRFSQVSPTAPQASAGAPPVTPSPAAATPANAPAANVPAGTASHTPPNAPVPVSAAPVPLIVTLSRAGGSGRVPIGKPVMISAYASLPPGQSATLAISYDKDNGPRTLLSLAQGSLSSAAWTPVAPGRYKFTASALDSRKNGAFSHSLVIMADAPPAPVKPAPAEIAAAPAARPALPTPVRVASRTPAPKPSAPAPHRKPPVPPAPSHPSPYHVAAASFRVKPIAETLAGALRRRGFDAFVRPTAKGKRPKMYRVETGDYVHLQDAQKQISLLKRDGYPAYLFQSH